MIKTIKLKFGRAAGTSPESIQTTPVTVFVGPNNSGKSKVLEEIYRYCASGQKSTTDVILDQPEFENFSADVAEQKISHFALRPHASETLLPGHLVVGKRGIRVQIEKDRLINAFGDTNAHSTEFCSWYLKYNILKLDGLSRIGLINEQPAGDLQQPAQTSFQVLLRDDQKRAEVRRIIHDAFGTYFVVDPTYLGHLRVRLSARPPVSDIEERGIHDEAVRFHGDALPIEQSSDGVKAFTGMITEITAGDPTVLLIDEPEAFLHPSLSFKLGHQISRASLGSQKRLFVSTHSPDFVMG